MPVDVRVVLATVTSASFMGPRAAALAPAGTQRERFACGVAGEALVAVPARGASAAVFHSPQAEQCPNHRGCSLPQDVQ